MMQQARRFLFTVIGIIFRHPIAGTTIVPILPDGRIVMIRRRDTGQWGLPGGVIDWGEDIPTAARRELAEETGLQLQKVRRLVGVYSAPFRDPRVHSISILVAADVAGDLAPQDVLEVAEVKAFERDELPQGNLSHDHDRQLQDFLGGATTLA